MTGLGAAQRLFLSSTVSFSRQPAIAVTGSYSVTSWVSLLFLLFINPNCRLKISNVTGVTLVGLKGTVLVLKGVSQCCVG